mgnify:CR=1 FL=1
MIFLNKKIVFEVLDNNKQQRNIIKNMMFAFIYGGTICLFGEIILTISIKIFNFDNSTAKLMMYLILILSSCIITGLGFYDKLGRYAGTGTIIPITGFANSMTSSGIESKPEGICCGIFMNLFKLAGSVISSSIVFGVIVGFISWVINYL